MEDRSRAFAALIKDEHILMGRVFNGVKDYWTLPGGGLEDGETYEEAVIREVQEEVNLTKVVNICTPILIKCFLVEKIDEHSNPISGFDPESY